LGQKLAKIKFLKRKFLQFIADFDKKRAKITSGVIAYFSGKLAFNCL